jgi:putative CocE/NonD family hydrolase
MDNDRKIDSDSLAFFDYHLRGIDNEVAGWAPVRYQHENLGWQNADTWPLPGGDNRTLYLDSGLGLADTAPASGLATLPYDPADPSPSMGGSTLAPYNCVADPNPLICMLTPDENNLLLHGPLSQAALLDRSDQLTFRTGGLTEPLPLLGEMRLQADIATSGVDCDLAVRILDIDENGDPRLIGEGIQKLSGRDDRRSYSEVTPGQRYSLTVEIQKDFAYSIPAGHRLGVMLSAGNWPLYSRNPADGAVFMRSDTLPGTNETFSYGSPPTEVSLKGDGAAAGVTVYLDGATRVEFGTVQ